MRVASFVCLLIKPGVQEMEFRSAHKPFLMNCAKMFDFNSGSFYSVRAFAVAAVKVVGGDIIDSFPFASQ